MFLEKRAAEATVANGSQVAAQADSLGNLKVADARVYATIVDLATNDDVVVTSSPAALLGVYVNVVMSAHAALLKDGTTTKLTLPASTAAGTQIACYGSTFASNITVESNDSGTGTIVVFWRPL